MRDLMEPTLATGRARRGVPRPLGHRAGVWWASPLSPLFLLVIPMMTIATLLPASDYVARWKTVKVFDLDAYLLTLAGALAFSVGVVVMTRGRLGLAARDEWPTLSPVARRVLHRAFGITFRVSCAAYATWVGLAISRGLRLAMLVTVLRDQNTFSDQISRLFNGIPGVTTFTQAGVAVVVIGTLLTCNTPNRAIRRRVALIFVLGALRAYFLTERLAIIELVVPWLVIRSGHLAATRRRSFGRTAVRVGPLLAVPLLLAGFSLFEYSRSWTFARTHTDQTFLEYSGYRLLGYYATSFNNGELVQTQPGDGNALPYYTVQFVWTAPIIGPALGDPRSVTTAKADPRYNPEFNSISGMSVPFIDYGSAGGLIYFLGVGVVVGWLYQDFASSRMLGVLLYPILFVGLLEMPRYLYWTQGRAVPAFAVLVFIALAASTRARAVHAAHARQLVHGSV